MHELRTVFPDPSVIQSLQPEELAAKMLFVLRRRRFDGSQRPVFTLGNEIANIWPHYHTEAGQWTRIEGPLREEVNLAISEAWAWLTAQGLLVPGPGAGDGWYALSRRARQFESEAEFASYATARLLPREILLHQLADRVWLAFMRGEFDTAVFQALKAVEVEVRIAAALPDDLVGTKLMRRAFDPKSGPLTDMKTEDGEREARSALFAGAIGSYKNPQSHRDVNLEDPAEALEIILLANHLLRIVEVRRNTLGFAK